MRVHFQLSKFSSDPKKFRTSKWNKESWVHDKSKWIRECNLFVCLLLVFVPRPPRCYNFITNLWKMCRPGTQSKKKMDFWRPASGILLLGCRILGSWRCFSLEVCIQSAIGRREMASWLSDMMPSELEPPKSSVPWQGHFWVFKSTADWKPIVAEVLNVEPLRDDVADGTSFDIHCMDICRGDQHEREWKADGAGIDQGQHDHLEESLGGNIQFRPHVWELRGTANSGLPGMFTNPRTNNGYHLDWCMSWAGDCGCPVAHSFCRRMRYREVGGFQITRSVRSVTQSLGSGQICVTGSTHQGCNGFQFIECIWQSLSLRFENKGNKACHTS